MIVVEFLRRDFENLTHDESFVRSYATPDDLPESGVNTLSSRVSILHLVRPTMARFEAARALIASMQFKDVHVVLDFDRNIDGWCETRDALVRIKKYMTVTFHQEFARTRPSYNSLLALCGISIENTIPGATIEIAPEDVARVFSVIRDPSRQLALARIDYYKTPNASPSIGRLRDIQHLNLLKYIEQDLSLPLVFSGEHSLIEIGAALGFIYRFAQSKGLRDITVIDKNEGFCAIATIDGVPTVMNTDLTDQKFCDVFRRRHPDGASYFFAKGVLNVYAHPNLEQYKAVVETVTDAIRVVGVWITYNVDRKNPNDTEKLKTSNKVFTAAGWSKIDVPTSHLRLLGIDYPSDVDSSFWVIDRSKDNRSTTPARAR